MGGQGEQPNLGREGGEPTLLDGGRPAAHNHLDGLDGPDGLDGAPHHDGELPALDAGDAEPGPPALSLASRANTSACCI